MDYTFPINRTWSYLANADTTPTKAAPGLVFCRIFAAD